MNKISKRRLGAVAILILFVLSIYASFISIDVVKAETQQSAIVIEKAEIQPSGKLVLNINLTKNSGMVMLYFTLDYPKSSLTYLGFEKGDALSEMTFTPPGTDNPTPYPKFLWDNWGREENNFTTGTLLTVEFKLRSEGDMKVTLKDIGAQNFDGKFNNIGLDVTPFEVTSGDSKDNNNNQLMIALIVMCCVVVLGVAIAVIVIAVRKRR